MSEEHSSASRADPPDRMAQFLEGVYALQLPNEIERRERRLYWASIVLVLAGLVVIGLGWWGASGTKYVYQEVPYVISGGIFGVALVLVGTALFARYSVARLLRFWLARLVADQQIQTDRVVDTIASLASVTSAAAVDDEPRPSDQSAPATVKDDERQ